MLSRSSRPLLRPREGGSHRQVYSSRHQRDEESDLRLEVRHVRVLVFIFHWWAPGEHDFKSDIIFYEVLGNSNGMMSLQVYIDQILEPVMKPWLLEKQDFVLEEDGDSGHGKAKNLPPPSPVMSGRVFIDRSNRFSSSVSHWV